MSLSSFGFWVVFRRSCGIILSAVGISKSLWAIDTVTYANERQGDRGSFDAFVRSSFMTHVARCSWSKEECQMFAIQELTDVDQRCIGSIIR
uniref:Putative secreted peptide n=1 Tax=Anopheles braziliensis TaxID=58242 RepID=A0A2M3ZVT0_9DIPT